MGNKNSTLEKDRQKEATELANNAAQKHAKYYDGTLHSLSGTFPVQKVNELGKEWPPIILSNLSRFPPSTASKARMNRLNKQWTVGFKDCIQLILAFLSWSGELSSLQRISVRAFTTRLDKRGMVGSNWILVLILFTIILGLVRMLTNSSLPMTIALVLFSPIIFGSLFFIVPAIFFMLAILLIPALFVIPTVFFFIFVFNLLPFTNKRAGTFAKNSFGRIPIFNRSQKAEGKEGEEMRTTMAYQKTH